MPEEKQPLVEGEDYVMEGPNLVFTAAYHLKRGYCCEQGCRNCPWRDSKNDSGEEERVD